MYFCECSYLPSLVKIFFPQRKRRSVSTHTTHTHTHPSKIESGKLQWTDEYSLWQARVEAKSDLAMGQKWDASPHNQNIQNNSNSQSGQTHRPRDMLCIDLPCKNYNWGYCREHGDHRHYHRGMCTSAPSVLTELTWNTNDIMKALS